MILEVDAGPVDLKERCMWVPASIGRKVECSPLGRSGLHFVYGGVSIGPRINISQGNSNYPVSRNSLPVTIEKQFMQ